MRDLRADDALLLDSGDCIKAGNLAVPLRPEACWPRMAAAGVDAGTLGNRETHVRGAAFRAKLEGAQHPLLVANLRRRDGAKLDLPVQRSLILERGGLRIGLFGVMVAMVTERMATAALSEYLWDPPLEVARQVVSELRPQVDLLIALTHIGSRQDALLAEQCPELDAIFGGHSHTVLEQPLIVGRTAIMQGGSHGRFVGEYTWDRSTWSGHLIPMPPRR